jgi:hypothetical protein
MLAGENGPWQAETIRLELLEKYGVPVSEDNLGKIMAAISLITTDNFFRGLPSFLVTIHGLLGDGTDWSYAEPIDIDDLAWAVMEAILLCPPQKEDIFDPQIVAYCRILLKREGLMNPPSVLAFAREDAIYGDIAVFGEDILQEQAGRTEEINLYLEERQQELLQQISSLPISGLDATALNLAIQTELAELVDADRWD